MLIFCIRCCHVPLHALDTLDTLTMSGIREKDHRFVFNTTTDGSVSARPPPAQTWKEISQRNALQIAGLSVASRPLGKIGEIQHLFQSQESADCMKPRQTMNIKSIVCLFAVVFIWLLRATDVVATQMNFPQLSQSQMLLNIHRNLGLYITTAVLHVFWGHLFSVYSFLVNILKSSAVLKLISSILSSTGHIFLLSDVWLKW